MNLKLLAICTLTIGFGSIASARHKQPSPRLDVIWNAMQSRLTDQLDYWYDDGDYPRCIQLLRVIAEANPDDYEAATDLGYMLGNVESYDEELAVYIKYRRDNPDNVDAPFPEANFYFTHKVYSKVPPLLEPTLKNGPHANAYRILAHSYERLGLLKDSKRVWDTYLGVNPKDETAKANLRRVEGKMKQASGGTPPRH